MNKLLFFTIAVTLITSAAQATTEEAQNRANRIAKALKKQNIQFREKYWHGLLKYKGSTTIKTTLKAGTQYVLVAGGCEDARDIDIIVYDENWNEVGRDTKVDAVPVVRVKPKWSGNFHIKVQMSNSTRNGAHYALIIGYK
ncbi:hypothetical protein JIN77_00565 [Verrucomicrobiaceae bacterium R5-34]|uniref:Uncharacterized protein n=1 Tax=Oceaniferula flava TaxID=2800421 RepID=A0AAE2SAM3_9BACT|nr:hypothetical protein [Oceaniferula flavus]MBK1829205.1 hypothetical protein [Verrucomicrobiaceae bacterium R5-34]MBK1853442.1 hypothetical protein [Oceaniferula flavus]MBM1134747.1 hypothetical protein [Oceaniferula flavus]